MHFLKMLSPLSGGLLLGMMVLVVGAQAQVAPPYLNYSAKFTCGTEDPTEPDDVVAGTYATSINIHNPQASVSVGFLKKIVVAHREGTDFVQPIIREGVLQPDQADFVDCAFINAILPAPLPYVEGFVVLEVPPADPASGRQPVLDVVAKYTAEPSAGGGVSTHNVVVVTGTPITF